MPDPVDNAAGYIGTPYVFGGNSKSGIDCSALIQIAYGGKLPRVAHEQFNQTARIDPKQLLRGDLVFLHRTQKSHPVPDDWASHVGIYDGQGGVIHAGSKGVARVPLGYFTQSPNFFGAGRVDPAHKLANTTLTSIPNFPTSSLGISPTMPAKSTKRPPVQPPAVSPQLDALTQQVTNQLTGSLNRPVVNPWTQPAPDLANAMGVNPPAVSTPVQPLPGSDVFGAAPPAVGPVRDRGHALGFSAQPQPQAPTRLQLAAQFGADAANRPNQYDAEGLRANADTAKANALQNWITDHPAPTVEYQNYELPEAPARQQAAIPDRPAPGSDPASTILAGLAGIIDPIGAGQYAANPIHAAIQVADQQYQDRKAHFAEATQQLDKEYADRMNVFHSVVNNDLYNRENTHQADMLNRAEQIRRDAHLGGLNAETAGNSVLAPGYSQLSGQEHTAAEAGQKLGLITADENAARLQQQTQMQQDQHQMGLAETLVRIGATNAQKQAALAEVQHLHALQFDPNSPQNQARLTTAGAAADRAAAYGQGVDNRGAYMDWKQGGQMLPDGTSAGIHYPAGYQPGQGHSAHSSNAPAADPISKAESAPELAYWRKTLADLQHQRNKLVAAGKDTTNVDREMATQNQKAQSVKANVYGRYGLNPDGTPQQAVNNALPHTVTGQVAPAPAGTQVPLPSGANGTHTAAPGLTPAQRKAIAAKKTANPPAASAPGTLPPGFSNIRIVPGK